MKRTAQARWTGTLKEGKGQLSTESGALKNVPYAFTNRFENTPGTNPEELIGAAHAGCFSMAFSNKLGEAGLKIESIETTAEINFEKRPEGWTVTASHLKTRAHVPGADANKVRELADAAKAGCPISRLLKAEITLDLDVKTETTATTMGHAR